jgi:hypothetical protein
MGGAVKSVGDFIQDEVIDPVKEVGRDVDDFVNEEIPGGWYTVGAAAGGAYLYNTAGASAAAGSAGTAGTATGTAAGTGAVATPVAGWGGTVTQIAPISTAEAVAAGSLAYPGVEVAPTFTPAPGSLQATLPSLGVETAASAAPFTAAPGSFQAATAGGLLSSASSGIGIKEAVDAVRAANAVKNLLGQPTAQIPQMRRQMIQPQGAVQYPSLDLLRMQPIQRQSLL